MKCFQFAVLIIHSPSTHQKLSVTTKQLQDTNVIYQTYSGLLEIHILGVINENFALRRKGIVPNTKRSKIHKMGMCQSARVPWLPHRFHYILVVLLCFFMIILLILDWPIWFIFYATGHDIIIGMQSIPMIISWSMQFVQNVFSLFIHGLLICGVHVIMYVVSRPTVYVLNRVLFSVFYKH